MTSMPQLCAIPTAKTLLSGVPRHDLVGRMFHRLLVVSRAPSRPATKGSTRTFWNCTCECGSPRVARTDALLNGGAVSCGCAHTTHGHAGGRGKRVSPTYRSWKAMTGRCANATHHAFADYGGRGIRVCERWRDSFEAFLADMGERPAGMSIDRIDNDGNYEPSNCRWATAKEQSRNRRTGKLCEVSAALIRHMHRRGARNIDLVWAFGIGAASISGIVSGRTWRSL